MTFILSLTVVVSFSMLYQDVQVCHTLTESAAVTWEIKSRLSTACLTVCEFLVPPHHRGLQLFFSWHPHWTLKKKRKPGFFHLSSQFVFYFSQDSIRTGHLSQTSLQEHNSRMSVKKWETRVTEQTQNKVSEKTQPIRSMNPSNQTIWF